jgi:hypothetical protein
MKQGERQPERTTMSTHHLAVEAVLAAESKDQGRSAFWRVHNALKKMGLKPSESKTKGGVLGPYPYTAVFEADSFDRPAVEKKLKAFVSQNKAWSYAIKVGDPNTVSVTFEPVDKKASRPERTTMSTHELAAKVAKTDPSLAYDMVLGADEPLPVGAGEALPEPSKLALINSRDFLRTAIMAMNQGNYPNMVKALSTLVTNIGTVIHSFGDLEPESMLLQKAGQKLLRSKGEVKRVKTADLVQLAATNPKLAYEMFLAADDKDSEDEDKKDDEDKDEKGKAFPGAAPPFGKKEAEDEDKKEAEDEEKDDKEKGKAFPGAAPPFKKGDK